MQRGQRLASTRWRGDRRPVAAAALLQLFVHPAPLLVLGDVRVEQAARIVRQCIVREAAAVEVAPDGVKVPTRQPLQVVREDAACALFAAAREVEPAYLVLHLRLGLVGKGARVALLASPAQEEGAHCLGLLRLREDNDVTSMRPLRLLVLLAVESALLLGPVLLLVMGLAFASVASLATLAAISPAPCLLLLLLLLPLLLLPLSCPPVPLLATLMRTSPTHPLLVRAVPLLLLSLLLRVCPDLLGVVGRLCPRGCLLLLRLRRSDQGDIPGAAGR